MKSRHTAGDIHSHECSPQSIPIVGFVDWSPSPCLALQIVQTDWRTLSQIRNVP